jgi:hypothetical protein
MILLWSFSTDPHFPTAGRDFNRSREQVSVVSFILRCLFIENFHHAE